MICDDRCYHLHSSRGVLGDRVAPGFGFSFNPQEPSGGGMPMQWKVDASENRSVTIRSKERALQAAIATAWLCVSYLTMSKSHGGSAPFFQSGDMFGMVIAVAPALWVAWKILTREVLTVGASEIEVTRMLLWFQLGESRKLLIRDVHDISLDEARFTGKGRNYVFRHVTLRATPTDLRLATDISEQDGRELLNALREMLHLSR
jgi:hypothetical protein